jgi:hypothetical protein
MNAQHTLNRRSVTIQRRNVPSPRVLSPHHEMIHRRAVIHRRATIHHRATIRRRNIPSLPGPNHHRATTLRRRPRSSGSRRAQNPSGKPSRLSLRIRDNEPLSLRGPSTENRSKGSKMKILNSVPVLVCSLLLISVSNAQERLRIINTALAIDSIASDQGARKQVTDPTYIPEGSRVYIAYVSGLPGFENNLVAALQKKQVKMLVVNDRSQADFEINGFAQSQRAGWAKIIFGSGLPESEASFQLVNLRTGVVAYAVASYKVDSLNGNKSTAEHLAKNLRQKMEREEKRIK